MDSHGRPVCADGHTQTHTDSHVESPRGPKSPEQSTGRVSVLSPRTNVLLCVLMDSHGRPVCADGHTRTATDVLCVLTDTHGRLVCADGHPRTSSTYSHGRAYVVVVTHRRPVVGLIDSQGDPNHAQTSTGRGQRAESKDNDARDVVLSESHRQQVVVLAGTHRRPVCTEQTAHMGQKSPKQSTGRASVLSPRTNVPLCVLMDSQRRPVCADGHTRIHTASHERHVCVLTVTHGRPLCADGHPQTSCVC
ncbi:hypothetical protein IGI04_042158 [Brassica rapa subsp. trilocularis]|uniref:Uncharacterized protein n=1 Tax=Brassica rapa subsp. trilocularis TaxID=1813537 RepID=A0ABQ7KK35_BRACM|nr:hypothetical protein IGI04_042158 [Brassica rapa subsp. trilocularis]